MLAAFRNHFSRNTFKPFFLFFYFFRYSRSVKRRMNTGLSEGRYLLDEFLHYTIFVIEIPVMFGLISQQKKENGRKFVFEQKLLHFFINIPRIFCTPK